jgi:tRNA U34 5-carboxymethylaminomethyl modifying GTPase MnmE/TrmE
MEIRFTGRMILFSSQPLNKTNIQQLKDKLLSFFQVSTVKSGDVLVTSLRHYQNLLQTHESLDRVLNGMTEGITGDFLAMDIRQSLHYLGEITGKITTDDLLENIFSRNSASVNRPYNFSDFSRTAIRLLIDITILLTS